MLAWAAKLFSRKPVEKSARRYTFAEVEQMRRAIKARYDAAQTTDENRRHWGWADSLSARAANSPSVRKKLRERARYERDNNSYADGIVQTLANDVVGTGPRLQILTENTEVNRAIEQRFAEWFEGAGFPEKLRLAVEAKVVDGESIGVITTNNELPTSVKVDLRLVETEQVTTPTPKVIPMYWVDGIEFDEQWNPAFYHVLRVHPGDMLGGLNPLEFDRVPAAEVIHWFRKRRVGQARGVPEITAALPLFAQMRRYTLATLSAAEIAADFAAMLQSDAPPDGETDDPTPFETLEIERGMMTVSPAGWKMHQFKAEHPTNTYEAFKWEILAEIARCINMPIGIAAGNSSKYNYSSGRLDHQSYHRSIKVVRGHCEVVVLRRLFAAWLDEALMIPGYLPREVPTDASQITLSWVWPGFGHVDPTKESSADETDLRNNTRTMADICAENGQDWETVLRQRAKEIALGRELGLVAEPSAKQTNASAAAKVPADGATDNEEADAEDANASD